SCIYLVIRAVVRNRSDIRLSRYQCALSDIGKSTLRMIAKNSGSGRRASKYLTVFACDEFPYVSLSRQCTTKIIHNLATWPMLKHFAICATGSIKPAIGRQRERPATFCIPKFQVNQKTTIADV